MSKPIEKETQNPNPISLNNQLNQGLKMLTTIALITTLITGTAGILIYMGKLGITFQGIGTISAQTAFLVGVGSYALSFIVLMAIILKCCMNRADERGNSPIPINNNDPNNGETEEIEGNRKEEEPKVDEIKNEGGQETDEIDKKTDN